MSHIKLFFSCTKYAHYTHSLTPNKIFQINASLYYEGRSLKMQIR